MYYTVPRQRTLISKNITTNRELPADTIPLTSAKTKTTVATVRPTVQQKSLHNKTDIAKQKVRHSNAVASSESLKVATSTPKISTSISLLARHQVAANTSTLNATSLSTIRNSNTTHRERPSFSKQRPATIVKPEKVVTKDPAEDPLSK